MVRKTFLTLGLISIVTSGLLAEAFTYKTYGGFGDAGELSHAASSHYTDQLTDGPWFREGPFSYYTVPWGDQNNKRDTRDPHNSTLDDGDDMWPALAWGKAPQRNPWMTTIPPHPAISGGGSGIGTTGYGGYGVTGHPITVDDPNTFAPFGSFTHFNSVINFYGSVAVAVGWNLELYDASNNMIGSPKHYHFTLNHWETYNHTTCPRNKLPDGTDASADTNVNDTTFNSNLPDATEHIGLGIDYIRDANSIDDTEYGCSDAFNFRYVAGVADSDPLEILPDGRLRDTFSHGGNDYEILFSGFYNIARQDCGEINYGQSANWNDLSCFEQAPALWSAERGTDVGYVRMQINKIDEGSNTGCTPGYWKQPQHVSDWTAPYDVNDSYAVTFGLTPADVNIYESFIGKNVYKKTVDESLKGDGIINLGEALWLEGNKKAANSDQYLQLIRTSTAALLNAANPNINYLYSVGEIIGMVQNGFGSGDPVAIKDLLEKQNEIGDADVCEQEPTELTT